MNEYNPKSQLVHCLRLLNTASIRCTLQPILSYIPVNWKQQTGVPSTAVPSCNIITSSLFKLIDFSLWKIELHILVYHTLSYKSSNKTLCDKTFLAPNLSTDKFRFPCENIVTLGRKKMLFSEASFCKKSLRPTNLKTRTAMNAKISVFLICVEVNIICYYIIWWL